MILACRWAPKPSIMAEKPRFRRGTVFAKNLGFGVGFGYRNNTNFPTFSVLHLYPVFYFLPHCWLCLDMCNLQEWIKWLTSQLGIRKLWFRAHMIERTWSEINECSTTLLTAERLVVLLIRRTLLIVTDILPTMTWSSDLSKKLSHCVHHNWMMCSS